jgi:hypothetical protein
MMSTYKPGPSLLLALTVLSATSTQTRAWGYEAHRVIAEIAEQFLAPQTSHQVRKLLALENATTLAAVSTWADEIRLQRSETGPWHYVNIPIALPSGELTIDEDK